ELEYARKISVTWTDNSSIPVKKYKHLIRFLAMDINGKSGEAINFQENIQKNCQQAANIYTKESDVYFKRRKKDGVFGTTEIYDASAIDGWLAEAKQRSYHVGIEKVECDLSGRPSGLMVSVNNLLKAGIILKYNDINGSSVSFVRLTIIGYHEKKSIREFSDILVFQRITQIGLELFNNLDQSDPMPKLLDWISSFHDLYTSPCHHCKKLLSFDSHVYKYLPPVRRVFIDGKFLPFHYHCYRQ
ncbi:447_t:CDS:2, partial [Dentiscutata heterogama]